MTLQVLRRHSLACCPDASGRLDAFGALGSPGLLSVRSDTPWMGYVLMAIGQCERQCMCRASTNRIRVVVWGTNGSN